jgi:hypothetical protein
MNQKRTARRGKPRARNGNSKILMLKNQVNGFTLHPDPDPPQWTSQPWNSLTVDFIIPAGSAGVEVTCLTVGTRIVDIIAPGLSVVGGDIVFKIINARAWSCIGGSVELVAFDYTKANNAADYELIQLKDFGTTSARGTVGYLFPSAISKIPQRTVGVSVLSAVNSANTAAVTGDGLLLFQVLWRLDAPATRMQQLTIVDSKGRFITSEASNHLVSINAATSMNSTPVVDF